jgi:hypothetical protein
MTIRSPKLYLSSPLPTVTLYLPLTHPDSAWQHNRNRHLAHSYPRTAEKILTP